MLARHDIIGGVENINLEDTATIDLNVDSVNRIRYNSSRNKKKSFQKIKNEVKRGRAFCPECHFLGRKLKFFTRRC